MGPSFEGVVEKKGLKLDPRTKFALLIVVSIVMMSGSMEGVAYIMRVVCALASFLLLLSVGRVKAAIIYALLLGSAVYCEGFVLPRLDGVTSLTLMIISGVISRFSPCYMMGYYTVSTTSVSEFVTAMERMHIPYLITIPLSVMFRFFPTLSEEYSNIHDAMKMREITIGRVGLFSYIEYILVPVMMSTVRISDELSAASLSKGLSVKGGRSHVCEIHMRFPDYFLIVLSFACLVTFFVA
ncbi:MAG: energy-coupling factor transporter transmembrane protein EcfT [Lachnospiraceae bacterium]|nr:energy-coupling factor transporter transmembrane protein EcfT [Lachnospiraceae bacterium]